MATTAEVQAKHNQQAKDELAIMQVLVEEPCSRKEIAQRLGIHENRTSRILGDLKKAGNVYRIKGTHLVALSS